MTVDWAAVEAIATVATAVLAAVAGFVAVLIFRIEKRRDDRFERRAVSKQAETVAAWIERPRSWPGQIHSPTVQIEVNVANNSPTPIYDVTVVVADQAGSEGHNVDIAIVPPGGFRGPVEVQRRMLEDDGSARVAIIFTDAASRRWLRREDGTLAEPVVAEPRPSIVSWPGAEAPGLAWPAS